MLRPDPAHIAQTVDLFLVQGAACELRIPKTPRDGTISGYYTDAGKLAKDIEALKGKGPGIYLTINPVPANLIARADNHWNSRAVVTTTDKDVISRRWLLLDFDPVRSSGISSTEAEHDAAIAAAREASVVLAGLGWPEPVIADSGNGGHLLYRINLPNDAESTELIKAVLKGAAQRFNTAAVSVDETVFNAARISKVYGTVAAKGDSTEECPHRVSRLLSVPVLIEVARHGLLQALADEVVKAAKKEPARPAARFNGLTVAFDVDTWLTRHNIEVERGPVPDKDGQKWVLKTCPFNEDHGKDAAIFQQASGAVGFKCFHHGCKDNTWTECRALFDGPRPERQEDAGEALRVRTDAVVASGMVEGAYADDIVQAMALAHLNGGRSQALRTIERFQTKFKKEFKTTLLRSRVTDEVSRLRIRRATASPDPGSGGRWQDQLLRKPGRFGEAEGGPAPCEMNAEIYFRNHPAFRDNVGFNEFTNELEVLRPLPVLGLLPGAQLKDIHGLRAMAWLQKETQEAKFGLNSVWHGLLLAAHAHSFHPVKNMLEALPPWDGVNRLQTWLATYCGAGPGTDDSATGVALGSFIAAIGERWMISAVARIYEPGCEVHHVLVLEGDKGAGKSTLVRILFNPWSGSIVGDVATKDSQAMLSSGIWCLELEELGILGKSAMQSVKAFVTRPFENFRPAYGRVHEKHPRQIVFLATVDRDDWADEDDRRWWPVKCSRAFDLEGLREDRGLLWAEALHRYRSGQRWHFHEEEDAALIATAKTEQAGRVQEDAMRLKYLNAATWVAENRPNTYGTCSVAEILENIQILPEKWRTFQSPCGKVLRKAGWTPYRVRIGGEPIQRYQHLERYPPVREESPVTDTEEREGWT